MSITIQDVLRAVKKDLRAKGNLKLVTWLEDPKNAAWAENFARKRLAAKTAARSKAATFGVGEMVTLNSPHAGQSTVQYRGKIGDDATVIGANGMQFTIPYAWLVKSKTATEAQAGKYDWQLNVSTGSYSVLIDDHIQLFRMARTKPPYLYWARERGGGFDVIEQGPIESTPQKAIAGLRKMIAAAKTAAAVAAAPRRTHNQRTKTSSFLRKPVEDYVAKIIAMNFAEDEFKGLKQPFIDVARTTMLLSPESYVESYGGDPRAPNDYLEIAVVGIMPKTRAAEENFSGGEVILGKTHKGWEVTDYV